VGSAAGLYSWQVSNDHDRNFHKKEMLTAKRSATMYQQLITENRAHQYQQDCRRQAATERALRAGRPQVATETAQPPPPQPALVKIIFAVRRVLIVAPAGK
jgi:hypothetical protein